MMKTTVKRFAQAVMAVIKRSCRTPMFSRAEDNMKQTQVYDEMQAKRASAATCCCVALWQAAGSPAMDTSCAGTCRTCGLKSVGVLFSKWVKDTFTNFDLLRQGEIVCEACQFCFAESHPIVQAKTNRPPPQKMRTYSHFVVGGEWHALTKGDKRRMRELLASNPTVAVIAESGQKHLIFRARAGWWQFEELAMLSDWERVESLLVTIEELMSEFSKAEIESNHYLQPRIAEFGFARWRELSSQLEPVRLSSYFQLAIFLAQKEENHDT